MCWIEICVIAFICLSDDSFNTITLHGKFFDTEERSRFRNHALSFTTQPFFQVGGGRNK